MFDFSLISKIDEYYSDIQKAGVLIPRSRLHIKQSAVMSYVIWGTSFSEYFGYQFWRRSHKEKKNIYDKKVYV